MLVLRNEHINVALLISNNLGEVLDDDVESSDVFAGVVAGLSAARNGRNWDRGSGLVGIDGGVSAVSEDNAIATLVVGCVLLECVNIKCIVFSGIAHSPSHFLSLLAASAWHAAGVALLDAAVTAVNTA